MRPQLRAPQASEQTSEKCGTNVKLGALPASEQTCGNAYPDCHVWPCAQAQLDDGVVCGATADAGSTSRNSTAQRGHTADAGSTGGNSAAWEGDSADAGSTGRNSAVWDGDARRNNAAVRGGAEYNSVGREGGMERNSSTSGAGQCCVDYAGWDAGCGMFKTVARARLPKGSGVHVGASGVEPLREAAGGSDSGGDRDACVVGARVLDVAAVKLRAVALGIEAACTLLRIDGAVAACSE